MDSCETGSECVDFNTLDHRGYWLGERLVLVPHGLVPPFHRLVDVLVDHSLLGLLLVGLVGTIGFKRDQLLPLGSPAVVS